MDALRSRQPSTPGRPSVGKSSLFNPLLEQDRAMAPNGSLNVDGFITCLRQEQLLRESVEALSQVRTAATLGIPHEMLLLDLYAALAPIDAINGGYHGRRHPQSDFFHVLHRQVEME